MKRLTVLSLLAAFSLSAQEYLWPTDASRLLTSSFAEARGGRFHAGIDFKTWGQTGYPVFAVRDGYISRISVSPFGYGRVLYHTLDTGEIALYAHLERFNETIGAYVSREQKKRNSYQVQLYPDKDLLLVKKGEIIGYTGQSGVGYPHLHFELRDRNSNPINPFSRGYIVDDRIAPVITKLLVQPLDALSAVNHDHLPMIVYPVHEGDGRYRLGQVLSVAGRIGFGVSGYDQMNGADHRFGVYRNELWIDDQLIFAAQYDQFAYQINNHFNLDRDYRQRIAGNGYFYNLFRDLGNELPFYRDASTYYGVIDFQSPNRDEGVKKIVKVYGGVSEFGGREHTLLVRTVDYWGNAAELRGKLTVDGEHLVIAQNEGAEDEVYVDNSPLAADSASSDRPFYYELSARFFDRFIRIKLTANRPGVGAPKVSGILCDGELFTMPVRKQGALTYVGAWPLSECTVGPLTLIIRPEGGGEAQTERLSFETVARRQEKTLRSEDGRCSLAFNRSSLFKDLFVRKETVNAGVQPFDVVGALYRFDPNDVPLDQGATLTIRYPDDDPLPTKLGIYQKSGDKYIFLDNRLDGEARTLTAKVSGLGVFTLVRDVKPPVISLLSPADNSRTTQRRPRLRALFSDNLSGIGGENSRILKLDGEKVIAEYDPEQALLFYQPEEPLTVGVHTLEAVVRDRSGNTAVLKHLFYVD